MTLPLRFICCDVSNAGSGGGGVCLQPVSLSEAADRAAVTRLAEQCRLGDPIHAGHFAPIGLLAELISRPGRTVHAWLAWPAGYREAAADCPLGLVALVAAGPAALPRCSIAWLLVDPAARRRGVAKALVSAAVAQAALLGATQVFAETHAEWTVAAAFWQAVGFKGV